MLSVKVGRQAATSPPRMAVYKITIEFFKRKTRSSKIGTGRRSIYNICILNDCKLTFEFFKNYIFEKRRQFLNRNVGIPKMYLNMMENLKSAKRILSSPVDKYSVNEDKWICVVPCWLKRAI